MSFFENVWQSDSSSEDFLKLFNGVAETASGVKVTFNTALRHSTVYACNRVLSESIASLPLVLYKEEKDGTRIKAKDHSLYKLLNSNPNPEQTTMQWRENMITNLNLRGNHFTQIIRNGAGKVSQLWSLDTTRMTAKRLQTTGEIVFIYDYSADGSNKQIAFKFNDILNVSGLSLDGISGISPIGYERESIGLSMAMEEFGNKYFKNGATSSGAFSIEGELSTEAYERMKKDFETSYSGMKNAHKPMILEGGAKFNPITLNNKDSQFLEARRYQKEDIAMIFRVPLHMLNDLTKANYNSLEQLSLGFVIYSLTPTLVRIEQCMQRDLLSDQERADGYYIKHNLSALLRGDSKTRFENYDKGIKGGIYTIDDVLKLEDMNPTNTDAGRARFMQGAMTTVDNVVSGANYNKGVTNG